MFQQICLCSSEYYTKWRCKMSCKTHLFILIQTELSSSLSVVYDVKLVHVSHVVNIKWFNIIIKSIMIMIWLFKLNNYSNLVFSCFQNGILHFAELAIWYVRLVSRTDLVFRNEPILIVRRKDGERLLSCSWNKQLFSLMSLCILKITQKSFVK
jgi:hypothetical protein